jgi:NAD(P)-dependent dehydrogenase (short-subunit alcohol dehydrogenase family)
MALHGTRGLVTGGSRGIGLAYAEALSEAGCSLVLNHFNDGEKARCECARLKQKSPCFKIDADVGSPDAARAMVEQSARLLGGLDIVISNAAICQFTPFLELDDETWQRHVNVNLSAGFWVTQHAAKVMVKAGKGGSQWCRGKTFDTFAPLGPCLVTPDEIPNPNQLSIRTILNGHLVQDWNTNDMIFDVPQLIEFLSGNTTLLPGTVILTGTPHGVGMASQPARWLSAGDIVTIEIERIGQLTNPVIAEKCS